MQEKAVTAAGQTHELPDPFFVLATQNPICLLYTSDAADERSSVDLGGRRIIQKTKSIKHDRRCDSHKLQKQETK